MSQVSAINPVIQEKLNQKRKILSRQDSSNVYSPSFEKDKKLNQQNIIKTPYIIMASSQEIQAVEKKLNEQGVEEEFFVDNDFPKGFYSLSNQEYSNDNPNIKIGTDLYNARNLNSEDKVQYRPAPGIKDLTSEFLSTNNTAFNRKVTINFVCYSLKDLEVLSERFMTLRRNVYVQWGWSTNKTTEPSILIKENGKVDYPEAKDPNKQKSEITRLQEMVIEKGQGDFDAVIGYVESFNYSLRDDGGFDCTTELLAQGVNIFDTPLEQQNRQNTEVSETGIKTNLADTQYSLFTEEINDLHNIANEEITSKGGRSDYESEIFTGFYQYEEFGVEERVKNEETQEKEVVERRAVLLSNKYFRKDENFIVSVDFQSRQTAEYTRGSEEFNNLGGDTSGWFGTNSANISTKTKSKHIDPNECWVKWGWFEDNILNKYFALVDDKDTIVSSYRSLQRTKKSIERDLENYPTLTEEDVLSTETPGRIGGSLSDDYESTRIETHKKFRTPDIKQFLFPGKFNIEYVIEAGSDIAIGQEIYKFAEAREKNLTGLINDDFKKEEEKVYTKYDIEQGSDREKEILRKYVQFKENGGDFGSLGRVGKALKTIENSKNNQDPGDLNPVGQTGDDKYLFLQKLQEISDNFEPFEIKDSFNKSDRGEGYLRNVLINIGHLQSIFSKGQAATLGETLNVLFDSFSQNLPQHLNGQLTIRYDIDGGFYSAQPRKLDQDFANKVNQLKQKNKPEEPVGIYEFPVHQQDSLVISQEITTDLTSEQFQALQAENLARQHNFLSPNNITIESQIDFMNTNQSNQTTKLSTLTPAYRKFGTSFGNKTSGQYRTSVVGNPINTWRRSGDDNNSSYVETTLDLKSKLSNQNKETEKDLESAKKIFDESPIPYDINGKLKSQYFDSMANATQTDNQNPNENQEGKPTIKVSQYGLVGLTTTLTLTGIAGIYPTNAFTTSYLPSLFKQENIFWIFNTTQNCSAETWTTQIEGRLAWKNRGSNE